MEVGNSATVLAAYELAAAIGGNTWKATWTHTLSCLHQGPFTRIAGEGALSFAAIKFVIDDADATRCCSRHCNRLEARRACSSSGSGKSIKMAAACVKFGLRAWSQGKYGRRPTSWAASNGARSSALASFQACASSLPISPKSAPGFAALMRSRLAFENSCGACRSHSARGP